MQIIHYQDLGSLANVAIGERIGIECSHFGAAQSFISSQAEIWILSPNPNQRSHKLRLSREKGTSEQKGEDGGRKRDCLEESAREQMKRSLSGVAMLRAYF